MRNELLLFEKISPGVEELSMGKIIVKDRLGVVALRFTKTTLDIKKVQKDYDSGIKTNLLNRKTFAGNLDVFLSDGNILLGREDVEEFLLDFKNDGPFCVLKFRLGHRKVNPAFPVLKPAYKKSKLLPPFYEGPKIPFSPWLPVGVQEHRQYRLQDEEAGTQK